MTDAEPDEQPALFIYTPGAPKVQERTTRAKTIARGVCPNHMWSGQLTGVIRYGQHYYWREHWIRAEHSTRSRLCTASSAPLHSAPAIDVPFQPRPDCPCERKP